jgi:hypothetical protein
MFSKILLATLAFMIASTSFASTTYKNLECKYNDPEEEKQAKFKLEASMEVIDNKNATLTYSALIHYPSDSNYSGFFGDQLENNVVFAVGKDLKNMKYNGRKYNNHFKFDLDWASVGGEIEYGELIISKNPVEVTANQHGSKVEVFTGALNVSYNDHHGDTVWVKCTRIVYNH